jgi:hypothetical protein
LSPFGHSLALPGPEEFYLTAQHLSGRVTKRLLTDVKKEMGEHLGSSINALGAEVTHIHIHPHEGISFIEQCVNHAYALSNALLAQVFPPHPAAPQGAPAPQHASISLELPRPEDKTAQVVLVRDRQTKMLLWAKPIAEAPSRKVGDKPRLVYAVPMASFEKVLKRVEADHATALTRLFPSLKLPWRVREQDLFVLRFKPFDDSVEAVEYVLRPYAFWHFSRDSYAEFILDPIEDARQRKARAKPFNGSFWRGNPKALGFIHGTVDRVASCFGSDNPMRGRIAPERIEALTRLYDDQVFAFDHPTASLTPEQNADWFIEHLPAPSGPVTLDLVAHSRGGLVARALRTKYRALEKKNITLGKIVYVGTPNAGTNLVDPKRDEQRLGEILITIYTNLFGHAGGEDADKGLRFLAHLVALGVGIPTAMLPGFQAMAAAPNDRFLQSLDAMPAEQQGKDFAIAAEWVPGQAIRDEVLSVIDAVVRPIHGDIGNDLIVPTSSVAGPMTPGRFRIPEERTMRLSSKQDVYHLSYFGRPETQEKILEWLAGELNVTTPPAQP